MNVRNMFMSQRQFTKRFKEFLPDLKVKESNGKRIYRFKLFFGIGKEQEAEAEKIEAVEPKQQEFQFEKSENLYDVCKRHNCMDIYKNARVQFDYKVSRGDLIGYVDKLNDKEPSERLKNLLNDLRGITDQEAEAQQKNQEAKEPEVTEEKIIEFFKKYPEHFYAVNQSKSIDKETRREQIIAFMDTYIENCEGKTKDDYIKMKKEFLQAI